MEKNFYYPTGWKEGEGTLVNDPLTYPTFFVVCIPKSYIYRGHWPYFCPNWKTQLHIQKSSYFRRKRTKAKIEYSHQKNPQKTSFLARKVISLTGKYLNIDVESFESEFESVCGQKKKI